MENKNETSKGNLVISEDVTIKIATTAALEVPGIVSVTAGFNGIGGIFNKEISRKPVSIGILDTGLDIDVSVCIKKGGNIPEICAELQKAVKNAVQDMTGSAVNKVNVYVVDVDLKTVNN